MQPNIEEYLSYEIKKEMADRYFGFRRLIEEDTLDLTEKIRQHSIILEKRICFELVRIYILLKDEELIHRFIKLTGWEEKLYYDSYLTESPTIRKRVFNGIKTRGLTKAGRFKNLLLDCYERLVNHVKQYREKHAELIISREIIEEEIKLFYQKNDIGTMMSFLRSLETQSCLGSMDGCIQVGLSESFEKSLKLEPPQPIEQLLPVIPPLVPFQAIRKKLKKLVDKAHGLHGDSFMESFAE